MPRLPILTRTTLILLFASLARFASSQEPPPSFQTVVGQIVKARNQETAYTVEYTLDTTDLLNLENRSATGRLTIAPGGFASDLTVVNATSGIDSLDILLQGSIHRKEIRILRDDQLWQLNANSKTALVKKVIPYSRKSTRPPFDPRSFGLALAGDRYRRSTLEEIATFLIDWGEPLDVSWVSDGVAKYDFDDTVFHIDVKRGFWHTYHRFVKIKDGQEILQSQAELTVADSNGAFVPTTAIFTTDRMREQYVMTWTFHEQGTELPTPEAVCEDLGIQRIR